MLDGLDLFSGIGGLTLALEPWVKPVAYCEVDRYSQAVLLSRMAEGSLPAAPIWDDVRTLSGYSLPAIDIICGGFPCQDISSAGAGAGLAGERSGLFFEILRLAKEVRLKFLFLENVPAIRQRGLDTVGWELAQAGYDCRWGIVSAAAVGANHRRERWFLLAHSQSEGLQRGGFGIRDEARIADPSDSSQDVCNAIGKGLQAWRNEIRPAHTGWDATAFRTDWWKTEPDVGRVVDGLPFRVDRIKGLGNAVVPLQARTAFEILCGLRRA